MITWKSALVLSLLVLATSAQYRDEQQQQQEGVQEQEGSLGGGNTLDPSVPEPPSQIPETSFLCDGKPYDPGMYADEETGCRVFHMCYQGRKESFICGTGTVFNQEILSCDYPDNVDCAASSQHYAANTELGKASSEPTSGQAPAPRPRPGGQRPTQQEEQELGGAEEPQYAARPSAPAPRPAAAPRPQVRPQAPPRPKTPPRAPAPSRPAPAQRPTSKARPAPARPAQRPVQQELGEQNLDYEPTQVIQRRVARQYAAPQESRAFQKRSNRRWSLMSERY